MAISQAYKTYIADCLARVGDIRIRSMMGGYLVYYRNKLVGDIGDNMLLVKHTVASDRLLCGSAQTYPYAESRTLMWVIENPEDTELLKALFDGMYDDLPTKAK